MPHEIAHLLNRTLHGPHVHPLELFDNIAGTPTAR
jgi:hypothetical protein